MVVVVFVTVVMVVRGMSGVIVHDDGGLGHTRYRRSTATERHFSAKPLRLSRNEKTDARGSARPHGGRGKGMKPHCDHRHYPDDRRPRRPVGKRREQKAQRITGRRHAISGE